VVTVPLDGVGDLRGRFGVLGGRTQERTPPPAVRALGVLVDRVEDRQQPLLVVGCRADGVVPHPTPTLVAPLERGRDQRLLAPEAAVERGRRHAGPCQHRVHRRRLDAAREHEVVDCVEQFFLGALAHRHGEQPRLVKVKRSFSFDDVRPNLVVVFGLCFIAATYGLVRLTYGLFLPDVQKDLGLGATGAGYISSGSSLIYCVAALAGFHLGSRRPRGLVVAAAATACLGVFGMAAAASVPVFAACAVLSSAGAGFASPALVSIVARNVAEPRLDSAQSVVNSGTGPGLVGAGALALVLLPEWRTSWVLIGVATAGLAVALLAVDRPTSTTRRETRLTKTWARQHLTCIAAAGLLGAGSSAVWTYGRSLLVETGAGSQRDTITAWILLGVGGTAVAATARPLAKLNPIDAWMLTCALVTCAVALLAVAPERMAVVLAACLTFGWAFVAASSALIAWTTRIDPANSAAGTAMLFVALTFGQAAGATALGFAISRSGFTTAFIAAAALTAAAVAVAVLDRRRDVGVSSRDAVGTAS
jgi:predicted MFS family arabinose efflux permease